MRVTVRVRAFVHACVRARMRCALHSAPSAWPLSVAVAVESDARPPADRIGGAAKRIQVPIVEEVQPVESVAAGACIALSRDLYSVCM